MSNAGEGRRSPPEMTQPEDIAQTERMLLYAIDFNLVNVPELAREKLIRTAIAHLEAKLPKQSGEAQQSSDKQRSVQTAAWELTPEAGQERVFTSQDEARQVAKQLIADENLAAIDAIMKDPKAYEQFTKFEVEFIRPERGNFFRSATMNATSSQVGGDPNMVIRVVNAGLLIGKIPIIKAEIVVSQAR